MVYWQQVGAGACASNCLYLFYMLKDSKFKRSGFKLMTGEMVNK